MTQNVAVRRDIEPLPHIWHYMETLPAFLIVLALACVVMAVRDYRRNAYDRDRLTWVARATDYLTTARDARNHDGWPLPMDPPAELVDAGPWHLRLALQRAVLWSRVVSHLEPTFARTPLTDDGPVGELRRAYLTAFTNAEYTRGVLEQILEIEERASARRSRSAQRNLVRLHARWRMDYDLAPHAWFLLDIDHVLGRDQDPAPYTYRRLVDPRHRDMLIGNAEQVMDGPMRAAA